MSAGQLEQVRDKLERAWTTKVSGSASANRASNTATLATDFTGWESLDADDSGIRPAAASAFGPADDSGR